MAHTATRSTLTGAAGLLLVLGLALSGCSATPGAPGDPAATQPAASESTSPPAAPDGPLDCKAVVDTLITYFDAAFAGMSTEATNRDVAAKFQGAADQFDSTPMPPGATAWGKLGQVIHAYADEWAALDPSGGAFGNLEPVEARVDAFSESIGFDNNDYDDNTDALIGEQCADEFEAIFEGD